MYFYECVSKWDWWDMFCSASRPQEKIQVCVCSTAQIPAFSCHISHHCLFHVYLFSYYLLRLRISSLVRSCFENLEICCGYWISIHISEASGFQTEPMQKYLVNMHSNISPVRNTSNGCEKTIHAIQKAAPLRLLVATREWGGLK